MLLPHFNCLAIHPATQSGIGLGAALAVVLSWERNKSVFWAIIAGVLSWLYVFYFVISRRPEERKP